MLPTWYDAGTVSVANGSTTVTGTSTLWGGDAIMPGDLFCDPAQPDIPPQRIASVTANGELELWANWPGTTISDGAYEIRYVGIIERSTAQTRRVLEQLGVVDANGRGLFFNFIGVTGDVDPGIGNVSVDNATFADIAHIYIDDIDANTNGQDVTSTVSLWTPGTILILRSPRSAAYMSFRVASVTIKSGYRDIGVTPVGSSSTLTTEAISVDWAIVGEGVSIDYVGTFAQRATYNAAAEGKFFASINGAGGSGGPTVLYRKQSAASGDWSSAIPFQGAAGDRGWAPVFAVVSDGARRVLRLVDYVGGEGDKPTAGINQYVSAGGMTATIGDATDIRGGTGATGFSAYQVAVANGFVGSEAAWLTSLNGADGTDPGILLNWDDGTTDADPGPGNIRADALDLSEATTLFVSKENRTGNDVAAWLADLAASTNVVKGSLTLTRSGGNAQATFNVTGLTDAADYVKITVAVHSGASGFIATDAISFQFTRYGDQGSSDLASVAGAVNGADAKAVPVAADGMLVTDSEDAGSGKKVTMAGAGLFLGTRVVDVCAAVAGSKGMAARLFVPGAVADGFRSNDGIDDGESENYVLDAGDGRVLPVAGEVAQVAQGTGTPIGNLTANGGLAAAFDGVTSQSYTACARSSSDTATSGYLGKDYSAAPKRIDHAIWFGSSDLGLNGSNGGSTTVTVILRGKNGSAPASRTDGAVLATYGPVTDANGHTASMESSDKDTAWDYVWFDCATSAANGIFMAEAQFFEIGSIQNLTVTTTPLPTDVGPESVVVTLIVRPIESIALNTDLTVEASRDNGATFELGTLVQLHGLGADRYCETAPISVNSQGAGDGVTVRIKSANQKELEIRGLYVEAR